MRLCILLWFILSASSCTPSPSQPVVHYPPRTSYSDSVRQYVNIDDPVIALTGVTVIDGTGTPARTNQTVLIQEGYIVATGPDDSIPLPPAAVLLELEGHTVIPGIVGTHNHLHMPRVPFMGYEASRLYLASGVTTIQTTGAASPEREKSLADSIHAGLLPGPDIYHTGPYFNGPDGSPVMITPRDSSHIDEVISYWTGQGVEWFKVYRHIRPGDLRQVIQIAHTYGANVTGHLCSVTYAEAARMGIDAIEHGFIHSFDHAPDKQPGLCSGSRTFRDTLAIDSPEVARVHRVLIDNGVAISTTPAIFEAQVPARAIADERTREVMAPWLITAYEDRQKRMAAAGDSWYFKEAWLTKSMAYNLAFYRKGGLLTAGLDPGLHNMPGFGDQRNFLLFVEAGFTTEEAIHVMTGNGAKLLGKTDTGTIEVGKQADLVVLRGDLVASSKAIEHVHLVFKEGYGFDPATLLIEVKGRVGNP